MLNFDGGAMAMRGLILVFTGDGKGKTTAALGTILRAVGHGMKCLLLQFVKARRDAVSYTHLTLPTTERV